MTEKTFVQALLETLSRSFKKTPKAEPAALRAKVEPSIAAFPKRSPVPKSLAAAVKRARPQLPPPPTKLRMKNQRAGRAYIRIMHALGHSEWTEISSEEARNPSQTQDFVGK
ncbi:MAG: hypothetical protein ABIR96_03910 [Bdellovibrionota bacterium]